MRRIKDTSRVKKKRLKAFDFLPRGYIHAREVRGLSTVVTIYDPVEDAQVHCLSKAEESVFYKLRMNPEIEKIRDQVPLDPKIVMAAAQKAGLPVPSNILTTDFVVLFRDGRMMAISVKDSRQSITNASEKHFEELCRREMLGKLYWENFNVEYMVMYGEDIGIDFVTNARTVLPFYNIFPNVTNGGNLFLHMVARGKIVLDLSDPRLSFEQEYRKHYPEVEREYLKIRKELGHEYLP